MATLGRISSSINSYQGPEGTCYGHTVARVFSRLIKVHFTNDFIIQDEKCSRYYNSIDCKNIFQCFAIEKVRNNTVFFANGACSTILDDDGQIKENISALLYTYIYKMVTAQQGCTDKGGYIHKAFQLMIDHFSDIRPINYEDVINTLIPENRDYFATLTPDFRNYFNKLIGKFVQIINSMKIKVKSDKINLIADQRINRRNFDYATFRPMLDILKSRNYYAALVIYDPEYPKLAHAVTMSHVEKVNGSYELVIKNSWGSQANWTLDGINLIKNNRVILGELPDRIEVVCSYVYFDSDTKSAAEKKAAAEEAKKKAALEEAKKKAAAEEAKKKAAEEEAKKKAAEEEAKKKAAEEEAKIKTDANNVAADTIAAEKAAVEKATKQKIDAEMVEEYLAMKRVEKEKAAADKAESEDKKRVENYKRLLEIENKNQDNRRRAPIIGEPSLWDNLFNTPRVVPPPVTILITDPDMIPILIEQAKTSDKEVMELALESLANLAKNNDNNIAIAAAGGIPVLVERLKSRNAKLQDSAAEVLLNMIRNVDLLKTISAAITINGLFVLAKSNNTKVIDIATTALLNRTTNDNDLYDISRTAIPVLIKLADLGNENALGVLVKLSVNYKKEIAQTEGAILVLIKLARSDNAKVKDMAIELLQYMSSNDEIKASIVNAGYAINGGKTRKSKKSKKANKYGKMKTKKGRK